MQPNPTKQCTKCGFIGTKDLFAQGRICKLCDRQRSREYYQANKEQCAATQKRRRDAHPERARAATANWILANKERYAANRKDHAAAHHESISAYQKRWREANVESIKAYQREYRIANKERNAVYQRAWHLDAQSKKDPAAIKRYTRESYIRNREMYRVLLGNNRARRKGASGTHTQAQLADLFAKQNGRCIACNADLSKSMEVDHVMPISLGGSNDISNIQLLCRLCNRRKHAKHPDDWRRALGK